MKKFILFLANSQRYFIHALRIAIFITLTVLSGFKIHSFPHDTMVYAGMAVIIAIGTMNLLGIWFHKIGLIAGLVLFTVSLLGMVLLSFESIGKFNPEHYVYYLFYSVCRLLILTVAGLICASDSAKQIFRDYVLRMGKA